MDKPKDNDETYFVTKILDDLRSRNRNNSLRRQFDTSIGLSANDSLLSSNKRLRSCSPDLSESMHIPVISPLESRQIKQELLDARAQIASLEERNKILFNHKKESFILFEKEKAALEHNINKSKLMIGQLDNRIKDLQNEKSNLKKENENLIQQTESISEEYNLRISNLEKKNKNLEDKLTNVTLELAKHQSEIASRNCTEFELNELKKTLRSNEKYIEELTCNLRKKQVEINTLETDQANQRIKAFENKLASLEEDRMDAQQEKLKRYNSMENELISLRNEVATYRC